jgi:hypothetical protein
MSDEIKCVYDECPYSGFCKRHTFAIKTFEEPYFATRPPVYDDHKCTMFVPISGLAEKIYRVSVTPAVSGIDVVN